MKSRVLLVFSILLGLMVSGTTLVVVRFERNSEKNAEVAVSSRQQILLGSEVLHTLSDIDQRARLGESTEWERSRFRDLVKNYTAEFKGSPEVNDLLNQLQIRYQSYEDALFSADVTRGNERSRTYARTLYQDVANNVNSLIELNANQTFKTMHDINIEGERICRAAFACLAVFVLLSLGACYFVIAVVTKPLTSFADFLDRVNVEDDLPGELPMMRSKAPEINLVAKSFEQLLQRLRGYRALNVRRLLIEKRRADIIAASISDGIFLLRGDEILYVNPVAQRMLEGNRDREDEFSSVAELNPMGLNLRKLAEVKPDSEDKDSDDRSNRCARAILLSIRQTMPVEMEVVQGDRKSHYLIQAHPISYDLIEQVEHSVKGPLEQILDRFQANTIVVAQDVTLVRESQEAKGHFLATLSHEIKTPVTSLTMATRLLSKKIEEIPNPSHRNLILTCVEDVDRLGRLLNDLLTISRFDLMIQQLEFQNIDFVKLLKNSVHSFQTQARDRDIKLTFSMQGKEGDKIIKNLFIPMDASKVAWAISNLLTNALRHTPRGGVVETRLIAANDEYIEVRVKDSGPGIELKRQGRIFDKFSSFYDIRVARSGSTGAGLSIAREIVAAHGGRIWVSSEPGQGAEFGFTLPLKRKQPEPASGLTSGRDIQGVKVQSQNGSIEKVAEGKKGASSGTSACG